MRKLSLAIAIIAVGVAVLWFSLVRESSDESIEHQDLAPVTSDQRAAVNANPIEAQKNNLDISEVEKSFDCVDEEGVITCGEYRGGYVMYYAALTGSQKVLDRFARESIVKLQANSALNVAAALGDLDTVRRIYELGEHFGALYATPIDEHPAIQAATFGSVDVLDFFVDRGLDVNQRFSDGYTDLFVEALIGRNPSVIDYLLANGYRIDCEFKFPNGKTYHDVASQLELSEVSEAIERECAGSKES